MMQLITSLLLGTDFVWLAVYRKKALISESSGSACIFFIMKRKGRSTAMMYVDIVTAFAGVVRQFVVAGRIHFFLN